MNRLGMLLLLLSGCGTATGTSVTIALQLVDVAVTDVGSAEVLALTGTSCATVLVPERPLDDATANIVAHGLFAPNQPDATSPRLHNLPLGPVVIYAELFASPSAVAPRLARGCAEATIGRVAQEIAVLIRK